jgi:hypothetical protein
MKEDDSSNSELVRQAYVLFAFDTVSRQKRESQKGECRITNKRTYIACSRTINTSTNFIRGEKNVQANLEICLVNSGDINSSGCLRRPTATSSDSNG